MERRLWVVTANSPIYPNLYSLLVSPPGVGKSQAIAVTQDLWMRSPDLYIAPDNVTKASLLDSLEEAKRNILLSPTEMVEYHSMQIASSEFGVFVPAHDLEFLSALNHIYDNPASYRENRRTTKKVLNVPFPQLTILAGTQPAYLANLLPETAWGMGFTSRLIFIYSGEPMTVDLFTATSINLAHRDLLVSGLNKITKMFGKYEFELAAQEAISGWNNSGRHPVPDHSKLAHYNSRRILHVLKLSMIACASRTNELLITLKDFERAKGWLLEAETHMPDIFRAMVMKSDADLLQDLHFFAWQIFARTKLPIHESRLIMFLQTKVPAERISKIIEIAEASGMFQREFGEQRLYTPKAKGLINVE